MAHVQVEIEKLERVRDHAFQTDASALGFTPDAEWPPIIYVWDTLALTTLALKSWGADEDQQYAIYHAFAGPMSLRVWAS
jgi:hypothetical protein